MPQPTLSPEQILDLAETQASSSVRIARKTLGQAAKILAMRICWRRLSTYLAAATPVLLAIIIAGSLIQTNSALVETLWEITAAGILLTGIVIAIADSRSYYLKPIKAESTPNQFEELQQLTARSSLAKAWHEVFSAEGREAHQFDLEIMWALATHELGKVEDEHTH